MKYFSASAEREFWVVIFPAAPSNYFRQLREDSFQIQYEDSESEIGLNETSYLTSKDFMMRQLKDNDCFPAKASNKSCV